MSSSRWNVRQCPMLFPPKNPRATRKQYTKKCQIKNQNVRNNLCPSFNTPQKMKSVSYSLFLFALSLWLVADGKSSKKGSKGSGDPCFELESLCIDRMTSGKGSQPPVPYQIWCKENMVEKCLAREPHSHSIERYERGRCPHCSFGSFCVFLLSGADPFFSCFPFIKKNIVPFETTQNASVGDCLTNPSQYMTVVNDCTCEAYCNCYESSSGGIVYELQCTSNSNLNC